MLTAMATLSPWTPNQSDPTHGLHSSFTGLQVSSQVSGLIDVKSSTMTTLILIVTIKDTNLEMEVAGVISAVQTIDPASCTAPLD